MFLFFDLFIVDVPSFTERPLPALPIDVTFLPLPLMEDLCFFFELAFAIM
jgi:hypothetical protein